MPGPDRFGEVIDQLGTALRLLGADGALQAAVGSWRDGQDDAATVAAIQEWIDSERDRIAAVVTTYRDLGFWQPGRPFKRTDHGKGLRGDWQKFMGTPEGTSR